MLMLLLARLSSLWRNLFSKREREQELTQEIDACLKMLIDLKTAEGIDPREARRMALIELGGEALIKEKIREVRMGYQLETWLQDLRYGLRLMRRNPGFTLIAVLTLALGIGANTAIFSVVNGVLLKPLPYEEPARLVRIFEDSRDYPKSPMSPANFLDYRKQNAMLESFAGYTRYDLQLAQEDGAERLKGMRISSGFFRTLGVRPLLGREFTGDEELQAVSLVVILSHNLWQRRFQGDPNIIGKTIKLSGRSGTIVGVMPAGLQHVGGGYRPLPHGESVDIWWPLSLGPSSRRDTHFVNTIGRLKAGVTREQAEAEFNALAARLAEAYPETNRDWRIVAQELHEEIVEGSQRALLLLLLAVFFVLLIACVNVANLMLARASMREREIAVRAALGAGHGRIMRQLLVESLTLAALGGIGGVGLAKLAVQALVKLRPEQLPRLEMIDLDGRVLFFTLFLSLLTGVLFGMAPALQSLKLNLNDLLKEGGRAVSSGRRQGRMRATLVIAEIALALVLLVGAGLLLRSFLKLQDVNPGFNPQGVLTMSIPVYKGPDQQIAFYDQLTARVSALPGVSAAGLTSDLPWSGYQNQAIFMIEGKTFPRDQRPHASYHFISADYMRALGVPLLEGRWFDARDTRQASPVILINQSMARKYWPGEGVIGRRITFSDDQQQDKDWTTIVGVIGDIKDHPAEAEAEPAFYWPITQQPYPELLLAIRTQSDPLSLVETVRREVRALDRELPIADVKTLETVTAAAIAGRRSALLLVGLFALTALTLAAIGIYGVMTYLVSQRTQEVGIRLALGAQGSDILGLIIRQGMKLAFVGVLIGLIASLLLTQLIKSVLFGVSVGDPLTFGLIIFLLTAVALLVCYIPAWRATKVEPMTVLRCE